MIYGILIVLIVMWVTLRVLARMGKDEKDKKRKRRRRRSRRDPMAGIDPYPGYFIDFRKVCRALGFGYDEGSTLRELVARVRAGSEATAPGFDDMVSYHYRVRYEDGARNKRTEREFQKAIRRFWKDNAE